MVQPAQKFLKCASIPNEEDDDRDEMTKFIYIYYYYTIKQKQDRRRKKMRKSLERNKQTKQTKNPTKLLLHTTSKSLTLKKTRLI